MTRIALIFLTRPDGCWFIHQRRSDKRIYPDRFGLGAGGRIEPAETPEAGAARELWEETGLRLPLQAVGSFWFEDGPIQHTVYLFTASTSAVLTNHEAEWQAVDWASPAQIESLLADERLCPDTAQAWRLLQRLHCRAR